MKIKELIDELKKMPENMLVIIESPDFDARCDLFRDIKKIEQIEVSNDTKVCSIVQDNFKYYFSRK